MTVADLQAATGIPVSIGEYDLARGIGNSLGDGNFSAVRSRGDGRQLSEFGFFVGSGQRGEDSGR
jgi:hypothetical protein